MDEMKVSGLEEDQEYECVLKSIASTAIMCKIKTIIQVDSLTVSFSQNMKTVILSLNVLSMLNLI